MNACFYPEGFPPPPEVRPVFVGFQTSSEPLVTRHRDYLRAHAPIGCRDRATAGLLRAHGVDAYVTGCLSFALPRRTHAPESAKVFLVAGRGAGRMPESLEAHVPPAVLARATRVEQRLSVTTLPMSDADARRVETEGERLLDLYRREAALVVTPLLHAAGPCLATGVPVVLARDDPADRFTAIDRLLPVHTPGTFHAIDWAPVCPDLEEPKARLRSVLSSALEGRPPATADRDFLTALFEGPPLSPRDVPPPTCDEPGLWQSLPLVGRLFR
jgi:hypothetical protein